MTQVDYLVMVTRYYEVLVFDPQQRQWESRLLFDCWRYADALAEASQSEGRARVDKILCQGTYELTRRTLFDSMKAPDQDLPPCA